MLPTRSVEDLRQLLVNFAKTSGLALANQLFPLLVEYDLDLHTYLETKTATMGSWGGYFEITLIASFSV